MVTKQKVFDKENTQDRISRLLNAQRLVPEKYKGSDKYFDLVSWNIAWFDSADPDRVKAITEVLSQINADIFVLMEIAQDGALDDVVNALAKKKAGFYSTFYGTTGGQQRVVLMWNRDWVRAKEDPNEVFSDNNPLLPAEFGVGKQKVFPRLPVFGYFEVQASQEGEEGFNFELMGVHLKAQGPNPKGYTGPKKRWGIPQRTKAAKMLAKWLEDPQEHYDTDVIIAGDWNAIPSEQEWAAIRELEKNDRIQFTSLNSEDEVSHLVRLNAKGLSGSRIDLHLVTDTASANTVPNQAGVVIKWSLFDNLEALGGVERQALFSQLKKRFSDHLPVVSRFYLTETP
jgi:endonuclease/exonuclease/phosphatase family metal-dependent hydrolase